MHKANTLAPSAGNLRSAIVIGSDTRSFLGVVRSLGRQGVAIDAVPFDFSSAALTSRYIRSVRRLPPLAMGTEDWVSALLAVCQETRPDFVIPCDDRSLIPLHLYRERTGLLKVGLPGPVAFESFFDKASTRELAQRCGVPVAAGRVLRADDDAHGLATEFGLPLFVKPRRSYAFQALERRRSVKVCRSVQALQDVLAHLDQRDAYLVESEFFGVGVGVSVLAHEGQVSQIFQHRRVREPLTGGGSSYRMSEALSADLQAMVLSMCATSQLEGLAMFEFKRNDDSGACVLLEVNARCWGSLPLAMDAGVDFPWLWFSQAQGMAPASTRPYRVPCRARNLLADTYAVLERIEARQPEGVWAMAGDGLGWLASMTQVFGRNEFVDEFAADDRGPGMTELRAMGRKALERFTRDLPGRRAIDTRRARALVRNIWRDAASGRRELLVVVACFGNICRSPYAAARLGQLLQGTAVLVTVVGAALSAGPTRASPERAVAAAARAGIDLSGHRSLYADDALLQSADLVLVFDGANLALLQARGLKLRHPPVRLREIVGADVAADADACNTGADIADPIDGNDDMFDRTYSLIDRAAAELRRQVQAAA
jgi:protein-tyrosine-phosphatase/predicted ATP-grasp superfamily ATP-dependent carboligase